MIKKSQEQLIAEEISITRQEHIVKKRHYEKYVRGIARKTQSIRGISEDTELLPRTTGDTQEKKRETLHI
jgi:polyribonucleotide nucleotidyltransferase